MAFRELFQGLSTEQTKLFRDFEKVQYKIVKNKLSCLFNETCLKEGLLPTYMNFKTPSTYMLFVLFHVKLIMIPRTRAVLANKQSLR